MLMWFPGTPLESEMATVLGIGRGFAEPHPPSVASIPPLQSARIRGVHWGRSQPGRCSLPTGTIPIAGWCWAGNLVEFSRTYLKSGGLCEWWLEAADRREGDWGGSSRP